MVRFQFIIIYQKVKTSFGGGIRRFLPFLGKAKISRNLKGIPPNIVFIQPQFSRPKIFLFEKNKLNLLNFNPRLAAHRIFFLRIMGSKNKKGRIFKKAVNLGPYLFKLSPAAFFVASQFFFTMCFIGTLVAAVLIVMYLLCINEYYRYIQCSPLNVNSQTSF